MLLFPIQPHSSVPNYFHKRQAFINLKGKRGSTHIKCKAATRSCILLLITGRTWKYLLPNKHLRSTVIQQIKIPWPLTFSWLLFLFLESKSWIAAGFFPASSQIWICCYCLSKRVCLCIYVRLCIYCVLLLDLYLEQSSCTCFLGIGIAGSLHTLASS